MNNNSKRIAKNTLMLYFRQILLLLISLYTVRVVLNTLGTEDYGIYNVVGGVVAMFSVINSAMSSATQRFINYSLGEKDNEKVNKVFSSSIIIHFIIAIIFVVLAETIGLWFVITKLNIPQERHTAMLWVYQFSIITTIVNIMRVPFDATIVAYEKMSFFAGISVFEGIAKLALVFLLVFLKFDKLISYAFLNFLVVFFVFLLYVFFCLIKIPTSHFRLIKDKKLLKEIFSFSGWSLFGSCANVYTRQGTNIALNMFFGVTVNAAMGIANQVNSAVYSFVTNFQTAFRPQLIQSYAEDNKSYLESLIFRCSRISFFLLLTIVVPLFVNVELVLTVWLKEVPPYAITFVRLILIYSLFDSFNGPLFITTQATGKIKKYQIIVSSLIFINLPLSIVAIWIWKNPLLVLYIRIALRIIITLWRAYYLKIQIALEFNKYVMYVLVRCVIIALCSFALTFFTWQFFTGYVRFFFSCFMSVVFNGLLIFFLGTNKEERTWAMTFIRKKIKKD